MECSRIAANGADALPRLISVLHHTAHARAKNKKGIQGSLSCQLYQRSADVFLGVPFNIASYALLTMMIAQVCNMEAAEFIHTFGDVHLYNNHIAQATLQLTRKPFPLPSMKINSAVKDIFGFCYEDFLHWKIISIIHR